ncbi:MAG TPA: UDP-3-O-(3-hydroxymyristoyl)glucosamine N-acyltransferase [Saprospiraceae bacterium]|nr:UDP-3-O-(3-hydroxymyristoyl)glucosamine N-acyltransferase [Saprospiraceae bacterium]
MRQFPYLYFMVITAGLIKQITGGQLFGDPEQTVSSASSIHHAGPGNLTFVAIPRYEPLIYTTKASIIIIPDSMDLVDKVNAAVIRVKDVYRAMADILELFNPRKHEFLHGNHHQIHSSAHLGSNVIVGQYCVIGPGTTIGNDTCIGDQVYIGPEVVIGKYCLIYPGVKIYFRTVIGDNCIIHSNAVIGCDGFGYARENDGVYKKIPQIGHVVIEDNVEIGACTVIDRATIEETRIGSGSKLDNLIQIAHNAKIGTHTAIAAQVGVSGSTTIGNHCMIGGQAGFVGHIEIADQTVVQAQSGVSSSVSQPGTKLYGYPAIDYQNYLKSYIYFKKLPDIVNRIREIERRLDQSEGAKSDNSDSE